MTKRKSEGGVLIVVELGAEWPSLAETREPAGGRRVLAQDEGESPTRFAARVGEQLDSLFARGVPLTSAVLACNERLDETAQRARSEIARTALGAMAKLRSGGLLLCAPDRSSGRLRHGLSALATELSREWQRAEVTATVRFGDEPEAAGENPADLSSRVGTRRGKDGRRKVA
jgi:hypothetical protein